jgi:UDP-N-acetylglucosamine--N-acetylmuramyl-(pentapeptide) pyrophosphoryl-undecaprenol N-acetylglucosamine transferase
MNAPLLTIMAGGTGGHVMPGLAIAQAMRARGWRVSWLGTRHGVENQLVPAAGIDLDRVDFAGLRGKGWLGMATGGLRLLAAFWQCLGILRRRRPDAVLGMGGYVTLPGGMMASLLGRPLVLVNADVDLLLSNRFLAPLADAICFGFDSADARKTKGSSVTGNAIREEVLQVGRQLPPQARYAARQGPLRLLVVGGSLGAQALNRTVPQALAALPAGFAIAVEHQTGAQHLEAVRAHYASLQLPRGVELRLGGFIDDMGRALAWADVVLCRAGALTISELCAAGVASILVPLVVSTTAHQQGNAAWLASHGGASVLPQAELTPERLAALLQRLTRAELAAMAEAAHRQARSDAAVQIAACIERLRAVPA